jgi:deoxyribodipyrimidine photolyase
MMDQEKQRVSLLWYKHDLRLNDHPGIYQALEESRDIVPVFVFDPVRYADLVESEEMANALVDAVGSLCRSLKGLGSDLVIKMGSWEDVVPDLVKQFGCDTIITEDECESIWSGGVELVKSRLNDNDMKVEMCLWRCQLFSGDYIDLYPGA